MTSKRIQPVILSGGAGTRLWPLSRRNFPKQFLPLIEEKSLLQMTLERVSRLDVNPVVVASEDHRFLIADTLHSAGLSGDVILEPVGRNTSAAMALAALNALTSGSEMLLFCPADHHIPDVDAFIETVKFGMTAAEAGALVTFGVTPSFPSTAYGYIKTGEECLRGGFKVSAFIEKPTADRAQALLLEGGVMWNAGIFLCEAARLVSAMETHAPDIMEVCQQAMAGKSTEDMVRGSSFIRPDPEAFAKARSQSIDYAVMERDSNVVVVPFIGQWSDVGSWNSVAAFSSADASGNRIDGKAIIHDSVNTFVYSHSREVVALGTRDLLIVDTPDALLVASQSHAEQVKDVVASLEKSGRDEAVSHRKVHRPWGWYDSVDRGNRFQVKRIGVKPGASLSLQKHHHRAEHWVVVQGIAEVTRGTETFLLSENQSTYIPIGEIHRLTNPGKVELEIIEIQSGSYLGEDDIVRMEDVYGRSSS
jgi:mannose-1-phosphate guanylyltransferase/mannose-6-phosphate isomerase